MLLLRCLAGAPAAGAASRGPPGPAGRGAGEGLLLLRVTVAVAALLPAHCLPLPVFSLCLLCTLLNKLATISLIIYICVCGSTYIYVLYIYILYCLR